MKAPEICGYMNWKYEAKKLNKPSILLMNEIFELLKYVERINDDAWFMWLNIERGTFEEYKKSKHYHSDIETEQVFLEYYPSETVWVPLLAIENKHIKFIRISSLSLSVEQPMQEPDSFAEDYTALLNWIIDAVQKVIDELTANIYNNKVKAELPYEHRYGTLKRKIFWEYYPQDKSRSLEDLTEKEICEFMSIIENETDDYMPNNPIKNMTFNKYFAIAYECFKNMGFDIGDDIFNAFEKYGEDFGGGIFYEIDFDSEQDFDDLLSEKKGGRGGHPWGLLRGSSRTRLMLYPEKTQNGYIFRFSGNPNWSIRDMVKCYITLKKLNVPIYFCNTEETINYLNEEDLVGFVPITRLPVYCQSEFNEKVDDFRQYSECDYCEIKHLIKWQEIDEVKLKR